MTLREREQIEKTLKEMGVDGDYQIIDVRCGTIPIFAGKTYSKKKLGSCRRRKK